MKTLEFIKDLGATLFCAFIVFPAFLIFLLAMKFADFLNNEV